MDKESKIVLDIYRRLYKAATPSVDFDELMANAPVNDRGQKEIDFMSYSLDETVFHEILEDEIKKHKRVPKWRKQMIRNTVCLGCSPRYA